MKAQFTTDEIGRMAYYGMVTDFDFDDTPADYGVPISTVMRLLGDGEL